MKVCTCWQRRRRGPAAAATNSLPATLPHHASRWPSGRRSDRAACSSCAAAFVSAPQRSVDDHREHDDEQRAQHALVARAAGPAQAVNIMAEEQCCRWLLHGAPPLCAAAAQALWHSSQAHTWRPQPCPASLVLVIACLWMAEVKWLVIVKL